MKCATFNVNSIKMRLPIVLDWLAAHQPDILGIQELKGLDFPVDAFRTAGYDAIVVPQKAYNGVALVVGPNVVRDTTPPVTQLPGMEDDESARFVAIRITAPVACTVINIYAPNGNPVGTDKYAYKLRWLNALYEYLAAMRARGENAVIMGDFNIIPGDGDAAHPDNWRGDALAQPDVRGIYRAMQYLGFTDALKAHGGKDSNTADLYTFWDYQSGAWPRNNGIRIDHVLVTPALADLVVGAHVDRAPRGGDHPSDHTPVVVEIEDYRVIPAKAGI